MPIISRLTILLFFIFAGCAEEKETVSSNPTDPKSEVAFDSKKWKTKQGSDYSYREELVSSVLYSDSIRSLTKPNVIDLLGKADRIR
jgi:hypothetical protein